MIGPVDAPCTALPQAWDVKDNGKPLDVAIRTCREECSQLDLCRRYTAELVDLGLPPVGLVQAGRVYGAAKWQPAGAAS